VVLVEHRTRTREVEVVGRRRVPRQRHDPIEVAANDAVLRGCGGQPLEAAELAKRRLLDILGQVELLEAGAQLGDLGLLRIRLAELLLDCLQLLAQEELPLALVELGLDLRLDPCPELEHLLLAVEDQQHLAQARFDVDELEQLLLLLGLESNRRGNEVAERARIVHVRGRDLQLLGQIGSEGDDLAEQGLDVPSERLDFLRFFEPVGDLDELADEVRLVEHPSLQPYAAQALHEDAHRPVGDADHLVDDRCRPDLVEIVPGRNVGLLVSHRDEGEEPVASDDVVDQLDRALLADRERRHRLRKDDRLLERQDGQRRRQLLAELFGALLLLGADVDLVLGLAHRPASDRPTSTGTLPCRALRCATGSTTFSIPRS
jgi:hypothetical protein